MCSFRLVIAARDQHPSITSKAFLGHDLARPGIPKKYSLQPRARKDAPHVEVRRRTRSVDEIACGNALPVAIETGEETCAKHVKTEDLYVSDVNENRSVRGVPTIKGGLERKGSVVLVTKSQTGETCFQVKTAVTCKAKGFRGDAV